jgi:hypothetical protein
LYLEASLQTQIHDFNPGIDAAGLFWTTMLPSHSFQADVESGTASLRVQNLDVDDYFTVGNALFGGGPKEVPATASYDVNWSGVQRRVDVRNTTDRFEGSYVINTDATINWTAANKSGFSFASSPDGSQVVTAQVGHERNGVFFH